ncbi:MAG: PEP/pyruvate-binding domain-containing protein, partial [Acidimicrobiia bacterium]
MTGGLSTLIDITQADAGGFAIGGKAAGLARLARSGIPVPQGVVVVAEATDEEIEGLSQLIADRFPGQRLAVRSSGVAEDSAHASFAGQFLTVLDVGSSGESIAAAVREVRASAGSAGVASYGGLPPMAMAVLVMPMIAAEAAGVAFTKDPVSGESVVVIEAVRGLGDQLAAGSVAGERWRVGNGTDRENDLEVLDAAQASAIADLAVRCEAASGSPQDIEWAMVGGDVTVLQSRPITTVDDVDPVPMDDPIPDGPWEWDSTHNRLPFTPLTESVFTEGFERASRRLAETYGAPIKQLSMTTINGYLYIQVVPPAGKPGSPSPPKPIMRTLFNVVPSLRGRKKAARIAREQRIDRQLLDEWSTKVGPATDATVDGWFEVDSADRSSEDLAGLIGEAVELQRSTFGWNMATDPGYLIPLSELNDFVIDHGLGGIDTTLRLLAGSSPSAYQASVRNLESLLDDRDRVAIVAGEVTTADELGSTFADAYRSHMAHHGYRALGFDFREKTLLERSDVELGRIATLPPQADPSRQADVLAGQIRSSLDPTDVRHFDEFVGEARRTYPIREAGEAVHSRVIGALRLLAIEAGHRMVSLGHLESPEHVIFLEVEELTAWLTAPSDLRHVARRRRGQDLWARGQSPQPRYGDAAPMPPIDHFPGDVQRILKVLNLVTTHDQIPAALADGADGVAASPGVYTGPV